MNGKVVHVFGGQPYDVYVGRTMPRQGLKDEGWGNPYRAGYDGDLETVLGKHERRMRNYLDTGEDGEFAEGLAALRGKTLACWCAPKDEPLTLDDPVVCHGQTLLKLAEELAGSE